MRNRNKLFKESKEREDRERELQANREKKNSREEMLRERIYEHDDVVWCHSIY